MQTLFQNICLRGKGRKGLSFCRRKTVHILFPCLFLKPGASGRPRSAKPQERVRVRAPARLERCRAISAPPHIPRRRGPGLSLRRGSSSSARRAPQVRAQEPSGRGVSANSRASRSRALPVSAQGGRYYSPGCPLLLLFLSTSCSAHHSYFRQPGSPSQ